MAHPLSRRLQRLEDRDRPPAARVTSAVVLPRFASTWTLESWSAFTSACLDGGLSPDAVPATPAEAMASTDAAGRLRVPVSLPADAFSLMLQAIGAPMPGSVDVVALTLDEVAN